MAEHSPDSLHVGLGIMRERAQGIGAQVQVRSAVGDGTTVVIELPEMPGHTRPVVAPLAMPNPEAHA